MRLHPIVCFTFTGIKPIVASKAFCQFDSVSIDWETDVDDACPPEHVTWEKDGQGIAHRIADGELEFDNQAYVGRMTVQDNHLGIKIPECIGEDNGDYHISARYPKKTLLRSYDNSRLFDQNIGGELQYSLFSMALPTMIIFLSLRARHYFCSSVSLDVCCILIVL